MAQTQQKRYILPIAIMFALFFMIAFVTGYQNPLGSVIQKMTGDNPVASQLGTLANFIAYAFMGYPAGIILQKRGYRATALSAVTVGAVGVLVTYFSGTIADPATAVAIYLTGAFISGFSMCMLNTVVNPMLNSLGKDQNQGNQLVQFGGSCNSLGATLAPVIVGGLLGGEASTIASANPVFYMAFGIFVAAWLVLYFSKLPEAPEMGKKADDIRISGALRYRNFTCGIIAIFCYVGIEVGIANWTLQYLTNSPAVASAEGLSAGAIAGTVVGVYWLLMLVGRLIGGAVGAKISSRVMLTVTSAVAIVLLVAGIVAAETPFPMVSFDSANLAFGVVDVPLNAIFLVLCGLCTSVMWGAIYNLSVEGLGKYTAIASGMFMVMVCGGGILPAIQGLVARTSILGSFWITAILCAYLLLYALVLSRRPGNLPDNTETLYEDGNPVKA